MSVGKDKLTPFNAVTITWTDPTQRTDGSNISPDTFNVLVFDSASPTPAVPIGTVAQGVQSFTSGVLSVGLHAFTLEADDSEGDISIATPLANFTISAALAAPNPPTDVQVVGANV